MEDRRETQVLIVDIEHDEHDAIYAERLLLSAIIMNAVHDLNKKGIKHRQAKDFFLDKNQDYIFSFRSICTYLNIDPSVILEGVGLRE